MVCSDPSARTALEAGDILYGTYWYENLFLIGTNLFLLFPIVKAFRLKRHTRTFVFGGAMIASIVYHACKTFDGIACLTHFCVLRSYDFFFSVLVLVSTGLYLIPFGELYDNNDENVAWIENWLIYGYGILITFFLVQSDASFGVFLWWVVSLTVSSVAIAVISLIAIAIRCGPLPKMDWQDFFIAVLFGVLGISFFVVEDKMGRDFYWVSHSLWHVFASFAQFYLLESRDLEYSGFDALINFCMGKKKIKKTKFFFK